MRRRILRRVRLPILLLLALIPIAAIAAPADLTSSQRQQLAAVRQATAKYHNVDKALADGYIAAPHCVAVPGLGTMGFHYINPTLMMDPAIDPLQPEVLLYVPSGNGLKLVAVEYLVFDTGQPHPTVFGMPLHGPMAGHEPGMPVHYDLHAWVWHPNPNGMFTDFNPSVSC